MQIVPAFLTRTGGFSDGQLFSIDIAARCSGRDREHAVDRIAGFGCRTCVGRHGCECSQYGSRHQESRVAAHSARRVARSASRSIRPIEHGLLRRLVPPTIRTDDRHRLLSGVGLGRWPGRFDYFSCNVRIGSQSAPGGVSANSRARSRNSAAGRSISAERPNEVAARSNSRARQCASPSA